MLSYIHSASCSHTPKSFVVRFHVHVEVMQTCMQMTHTRLYNNQTYICCVVYKSASRSELNETDIYDKWKGRKPYVYTYYIFRVHAMFVYANICKGFKTVLANLLFFKKLNFFHLFSLASDRSAFSASTLRWPCYLHTSITSLFSAAAWHCLVTRKRKIFTD